MKIIRAAGYLYLGLFTTPAFAAARTAPQLWITYSLERVGRRDPPGNETVVRLYAARAEYESFQIVIPAANRRFTRVMLESSDLSGPAGKIDRSNVTIYREHYVNVIKSSPDWHGSNRPLGPGWYADALSPLKARFDTEQGVNQPLWIDVFIPPETRKGTYAGKVRFTSDQASGSINVNVVVWGFELPKTPHLLSSFGYAGPIREVVAEELLRHKVMPQLTTSCRGDEPSGCPHNAQVERYLMDNWGLGATDTHFWSEASIGHCSMAPVPDIAAFQKAAAAHARGLFLYNYTADEIHECANLIPEIKSWARNMHAAGILNLLTIGPRPSLYDDGTGHPAVDIWAMTPAIYDICKDEIPRARKTGARFWSYNGLVQDGYSPKWQIDFLPINYRIQPGFISQSLGITGLLYWRVNAWRGDPWTDPVDNTGQFHPAASYPGEGVLVYPGDFAGVRGVIASMRLKQIRDGVEDYEYVELLKEAGRSDQALALARRVGADWTHWTRDPAALYAVRKQLGDEIEKLWPQ